MSNDEKREIEQFFKNVLLCLNIYNWTIRWVPNNSEGYCWKRRKLIDLGEEVEDKKHLLLHEIAHIFTCRFCNNKHTVEFWKCYDDLRRRFLPGEDSLYQGEHRKFMGKGFYSLVYENKKGE
jgi:hypothetical protein